MSEDKIPDFLETSALGFQEESHLAVDAMNIWYHLPLIFYQHAEGHINETGFLNELEKPLETYEQYYEQQFPNRLEQILPYAKPESLEKFDEQIHEYNSLPLKRKREGIYRKYIERCKAIIMKGQTPE